MPGLSAVGLVEVSRESGELQRDCGVQCADSLFSGGLCSVHCGVA